MTGSTVSGEVVFITIVSLLLSIAVYELRKKIPIPIIVCMVLAGFGARAIAESISYIHHTTELIDQVDSHFILLVLIPPLLFETAFSLEWYTFKKQFFQIFILATSGVIVSTTLIATFMEFVLYPGEYDITLFMVFAAILSATDHVSIVAHLKELHVEQKFSTLIQGETLLSEVTVLIILAVAEEFEQGDYFAMEEFLISGARLAFGGLALGLAFSIATLFWLRKMVNDPMQEVNLTIVATYLVFYVAEIPILAFSGALSVVTLGLTLSAYGKTVISPMTEHTMHNVWELLSRNIEALIFIFSGMIFAKHILVEQTLGGTEIGKFCCLFFMLYIIRAFNITLHYHAIKRLGYGLSFKEYATLCFSGLKGSITIILALLYYNESTYSSGERAFILVGSLQITLMSIIFDTLILEKVVKFFKLERKSAVQENLVVQVAVSIVKETYEEMERLKSSEDHKLSDWELVEKVAGSKKVIKNLLNTSNIGKKIVELYPDDQIEMIKAFSDEIFLSSEQVRAEIRRRFLSMVKVLAAEMLNKGQCMRKTLYAITKAVNMSLDNESSALNTWSTIIDLLMPKLLMKVLIKGSNIPLINSFFKRILYQRISTTYDAAICFIHAHNEAKHFLESMPFNTENNSFMIQTIIQESHNEVERCKEYIREHLTSTYPEILRYVQTYKSSHSILHIQRNIIENLYHNGMIEILEYEKLILDLDKNVKFLQLKYLPKVPTTLQMLQSVFPHMSAEYCSRILENSKEVFYQVGKPLFRRGENIKGGFVILKGSVKEYSDNWDEEHTIGSIAGIQHLLPSFTKNITTAKADTYVMALKVRNKNWDYDEKFEKEIWVKAAPKLIAIHKDKFGDIISRMEKEDVDKIISECRYAKYKAGEVINLISGGVLLLGDIEVFNAFCTMQPLSIYEMTATSDVIFLHFPGEVEAVMKLRNETFYQALMEYLTSKYDRNSVFMPYSNEINLHYLKALKSRKNSFAESASNKQTESVAGRSVDSSVFSRTPRPVSGIFSNKSGLTYSNRSRLQQ